MGGFRMDWGRGGGGRREDLKRKEGRIKLDLL